MAGNRAERIARVIREEASRVVLYELADPRIGFVTITKVKVSADLAHARVYVSVLGDQPVIDKTMAVLEGAVRVVQRAVGPRLKMRSMPHIDFEYDPSIEGAVRVSQLIREARATDFDSVAAAAAAAVPGGEASGEETGDEAGDDEGDDEGDGDADGDGGARE
jgi:ribosome-binding factor A